MKTRQECFAYIKGNERLQEKIKRNTGWCYSNLSTAELNDFIERDNNSIFTKIRRLFCK